MGRYAIRRLLLGLVLVVALTFSTYAVFSTIPYDPGRIAFAPGAAVPAAQLRAVDHRLGVDRPFYDQYLRFLQRLVLHGSLGRTFKGVRLDTIVASAAPVTGQLALGGGVLMLMLALPLALVSARRPDTRVDRVVLVSSILGIALHPFVVGVVLKSAFSSRLGLLPAGGYCPLHQMHQSAGGLPIAPGTRLSPQTALNLLNSGLLQQQLGSPTYETCHGAFWGWLWLEHMLLPWLTFALFFLPFYVRVIRTRLLDEYGEPYVLTARAKGASERRVLTHHVLRNIAGTTVTMLAFDVGTSITAAVYVETVYRLPGLGHQALVALGAEAGVESGYDLPTMTAIVVVVAAAVVVLNVIADLAAGWLDPRIRLVRAPR